MKKPVLLFDFDGTLVKLNKPKAFWEVVKEHAKEKEATLELAKILYQEDKKRCVVGKFDREGLFNIHIDKFREGITKKDLCEYFWDRVKELQSVKDGCYSTLDKLQDNYTLVCATDTDVLKNNKISRIDKVELLKYFSRVFIGSEDGLPPKGPRKGKYDGTEYIKRIIDILKVKPSECIMIGDKIDMDLAPAEKVDMSSILVKNSAYAGTWYWEVEKLSELVPRIKEIGKSQPKRREWKGEPRYNQQQYEMLERCSNKEEITEWKRWREENPDEDIVLQDAPLADMNLEGVDLKGAHLENADLSGAKLNKGADLWHAHLQGADLNFVHLIESILNEANLQNAKLFGAHLEEAKLNGANLECADLEEAFLEKVEMGQTNLKKANLSNAHLAGGELKGTNMRNSDLSCADLQHANLRESYLNCAKLKKAHLENADLENAHLRGTDLRYTYLEGARLIGAIVDGSTSFWMCKINHRTDFRGVGMESARIYPGTKQLLEYNIRRMNWEDWYKENWLLSWPVRWFWCLSDYGISTWRVIIWFLLLSLLFATIYANCAYWWPLGIVSNLKVEPHLPMWHCFLLLLLRPIYFSVVTMTTLGFGDMYANAQSIWGHILLSLQVILGYVLLGALVTRFAVLFTAGGPAGKFADDRDRKQRTDDR